MNTEQQNDVVKDVDAPNQREKRPGAPLFTVLFTVPFSTLGGLVLLTVSLAALLGGIAALGGLGYAVAAPFFATQTGVNGVFVQIGAGLILSGAGLVVFSAFFLLAKPCFTTYIRVLRYVNGR